MAVSLTVQTTTTTPSSTNPPSPGPPSSVSATTDSRPNTASSIDVKPNINNLGGGGGEKRKTSRRANTAERRATHNAVERQRRETLNGRFLDLAALLPNLSSVRRPSKSAIVNSSIALIHSQRRHRSIAARELRTLYAQFLALKAECDEWRSRAGVSPIGEECEGQRSVEFRALLEWRGDEEMGEEERGALRMAACAGAGGEDGEEEEELGENAAAAAGTPVTPGGFAQQQQAPVHVQAQAQQQAQVHVQAQQAQAQYAAAQAQYAAQHQFNRVRSSPHYAGPFDNGASEILLSNEPHLDAFNAYHHPHPQGQSPGLEMFGHQQAAHHGHGHGHGHAHGHMAPQVKSHAYDYHSHLSAPYTHHGHTTHAHAHGHGGMTLPSLPSLPLPVPVPSSFDDSASSHSASSEGGSPLPLPMMGGVSVGGGGGGNVCMSMFF